MKKSRFTYPEMATVLRQAREGTAVTRLCCEHDISVATFYKWRRDQRNRDASELVVLREDKKQLPEQINERHDVHRVKAPAPVEKIEETKERIPGAPPKKRIKPQTALPVQATGTPDGPSNVERIS